MVLKLNAPTALDFDAGGHLYATHPLHPFAARFPPPLARWAIQEFSRPGDVVLDPMVGSGTTLVEAALLRRSGLAADIDPLARLIARAKARLTAATTVERLTDELEVRLRRSRLQTPWTPALPDLERWFRPEVMLDLSRIRRAIVGTARSSKVADLLWTVFSSLIVARTSVANARDLVHSRHHYRPWEEDPKTCERFLDKLRRAALLMTDYGARLRDVDNPRPDVQVVGEDARDLPMRAASVDLVVTSPPYCSALDYTRAHTFAVGWMSDVLDVSVDDYRALGRRYVGSERGALEEASSPTALPPKFLPVVDALVDALRDHRKRAWIVHRYFRDMGAILREIARVLRPGGTGVLVVCPSNIRRVPIPTHEVFKEMAPIVSRGRLKVVQLHERTIHDGRRVMPYLEHAFGPRMRTEYVLVLAKVKAARRNGE